MCKYTLLTEISFLFLLIYMFQKVNDIRFRSQQYGLLITRNETEFAIVKQTLKIMNLRLDSNIFLALKSEDTYYLYEFYNPGPRSGGELRLCNSINYTEDHLTTNGLTTYEMRKDLSSLHLKVAFVVTKKNVSMPLEYLQDVRTKHYDGTNKVNFGIFKHMVDIHRYQWSLVVTPAWFSSTRLGIDIGLANVLTRNIADISGSSGLMTAGRVEAFDFGVGTHYFRTSFMFRSPVIYEKNLKKSFIVKPFSHGTWICAALCTMILCITAKFILQLERQMLKRYKEYSWCTIIMFMISLMSQQGINVPHSSTAGHIVVLSSLIFTFLLYNYYTSSIVSSALTSKKATFQSLGELVNSNLDIGIERIAYARILNASSNPLMFYLNNRAQSNDSRVSFCLPLEGVQRIRKGNFAYLAESVTTYNNIEEHFSNEEICELTEINAAQPTLTYIVGKKRGQYNELFSVSYRKIVQYGLLKREQIMFSNIKPHCFNAIQFVQVGLEQAVSALILLAIGYGITAVIFLIEIVTYTTIVRRQNWDRNIP
ncbi:hypothetical protein AMK59_8103 [Oryctes borbonicus]|uniref:Ionotropic glutamate receptor C-terminal domain-containing protein n=1 Tax=Oryctes borbonicus TaxID=1629725 RepID=A0A0T6ASJ7_9SCAR|nr:hypothetical protein AMK59_8103 [Oryctes borbonicus]